MFRMNRFGAVASGAGWIAIAIAACGGESSSSAPDGEKTGGAAGLSGSGGRSASGGVVAAGGSGPGGGATGGGGASCAELDDDAELSLSIVIANRTGRRLHVGYEETTCSIEPPFSVEDEDGRELAHLGSCRSPCESVRTGGPTGCPPVCLFSPTLTLEPDERAQLDWNGLVSLRTTVPSECTSVEDARGASCDLARALRLGTYRFSARAGTELDCRGTCGDCTLREGGGCETNGAVIAGDLVTAELTLRLDSGYGVGGAVGSGPPLPVELIFDD